MRPSKTNRWSGAFKLAVAGGAFIAVACGGSGPLLHPAHPLPPDAFTAGAGVSGQFTSGRVERYKDEARAVAAAPITDREQARVFWRGVLSDAVVAPGASPWVGARLGLPGSNEAGITYTGRSVRADVRHVFVWDAWALSLGAGASALLLSPDSEPPGRAPANDDALDATGWGVDIPILFGMRDSSGLFEAWAGARAGFQRLQGDLRLAANDPDTPRLIARATGHSLWGSALSGLSVGIPPLWLRFEFSATYQRLNGSLEPDEPERLPAFSDLDDHAWSYSPSAAILGKF
jgi:hypothetical protein